MTSELHERKKDKIRVVRKKQLRKFLRDSFLPAAPDERLLAELERATFEELEVRLNDPNSFLWRDGKKKPHSGQQQEVSSASEQVSHLAPASSSSPDRSAMDVDVADDGSAIEALEHCSQREVVLIRR